VQISAVNDYLLAKGFVHRHCAEEFAIFPSPDVDVL
jgi:hypothetical protein